MSNNWRNHETRRLQEIIQEVLEELGRRGERVDTPDGDSGNRPTTAHIGQDTVRESTLPRRNVRIDDPETLGSEDGATWLQYRLPDDKDAADLFEWWMQSSFEDFVATVPKMLEYGGENERRPGSADLRVVGEGLMELMGWPITEYNQRVAQELGCWFYLLGKSGRLISNYQQQQPGKPDTWFDIGIYAKMARRIQEVGRWP